MLQMANILIFQHFRLIENYDNFNAHLMQVFHRRRKSVTAKWI